MSETVGGVYEMTDIPQSTIDELRRLSAAATPGEWSAHDYRSDPSQEDWFGVIKGAFDIEGKCHQIGAFKFSALPSKENWANAQLIAAMRNNIDALLTALESAQANERRCRGVINVLADELAKYTGKTEHKEIKWAESIVDRNAAIDAATEGTK